MQKLITPRKLANFLTVVYGISLIPLLVIARYNYPGADDYTNGSACHQIWQATHSLWSVLGGAVKKAVSEWINWRGCFTSSFLSSLSPNVFGEQWYAITTWIVLGMFSLSTVYLMRIIFCQVFRADRYLCRCISMLMMIVTVHCMVGRVEIFYWYSGAINYLFTHGIVLIYLGLLVSSIYAKGKKRIYDLTVASVMGFLAGGGNQVTILYTAIILTVAVVIVTMRKKWKNCKAAMIPIALYYVGFILNIAAPGNWIRADDVSGMHPIKAIFVSLYYGLIYGVDEWTTWPVIMMILLMIPLFWHMARKTDFRFPYPLIVVLLGYGLVSSTATPPLFAVGNIEAERLQAMFFVMYITVLTLCVGYVVGWLNKKWDSNRENMGHELSEGTRWYIVVCVLFVGFATVITAIPEPHYFAFSSALTDLGNGSAQRYGQALEDRIELYKSGEKNVVVEPLPVQPDLLYFSDIKTDPEDWENKGVCRFYGLESVRVANYDE